MALLLCICSPTTCSDHSFMSMKMNFCFKLIPQLVMFSTFHISSKQLNLLYSESINNQKQSINVLYCNLNIVMIHPMTIKQNCIAPFYLSALYCQ